MKKSFNHYVLGIVLVVLSQVSCSKKVEYPESKDKDQVVITSVMPTEVKGGDTIKVMGTNLLKNIANTNLSLNGKKAVIFQATRDSIKAIVPSKAGSGRLLMQVGDDSIQGPAMTYEYKVTVTTIAGNGLAGNSDGLDASFKCPWGIVANKAGDLFVADSYNRLIRKIDAVDHSVSSYYLPVLINGKNFYSPYNIAIDTKTEDLFVTDFNEHLMKMDALGNNMDVIYIDSMPLTGVVVDPTSTHLYISNNSRGTIIRTDMDGQNATIFTTGLITPRNLIFNNKGQMFVAAYPGPIYEIDKNGTPSLEGTTSDFKGWEIATDTSGNFFLADHFSNCIRMMDKTGNSRIIAGSGEAADIDGIGLAAAFDGPMGITIDSKGDLYVTTYNFDRNSGNKVRKIVLE